MQNKTSVPFHLNEKMFRRYESHIATICRNYPLDSSFDPRPFSVETFKCRLRDAMRSVLTYNWPTHIDLDILTKVRREMVVIEVGGMVCVMVPRSKTANAWLDEQALSAEAPVIGKETVVENPTLPDLYALALLLHKKILVNPFRLVGAKREDLEDVLSRKYDIAVKENNDHTVTLF